MNYLHRHANIGYGSAHNLVMHGGNTHYHLVLNPDVELAPDALVAGMRFLDAHREIGVLAPAACPAATARANSLCKRYPAVLDLVLRGFAPALAAAAVPAALERYEMRDVIEAPAATDSCRRCR